jgi:hypothetical protein
VQNLIAGAVKSKESLPPNAEENARLASLEVEFAGSTHIIPKTDTDEAVGIPVPKPKPLPSLHPAAIVADAAAPRMTRPKLDASIPTPRPKPQTAIASAEQ